MALTISAIVTAFILQQSRQASSPTGAETMAGNSTARPGGPPPVLFEIPDFSLTNQAGLTVTRDSLRGQVWIADIIFTRCAGPCPKMTARMGELQSALPAHSPVQLVTLTTDPENDTPAVLKRYADRFGAREGSWQFLTGAKPELARLAIEGLKLTALDKDPTQRENDTDFFIHSTIFVLVDQHGRVRGSFESDEPGMQKEILAAIRQLQREK